MILEENEIFGLDDLKAKKNLTYFVYKTNSKPSKEDLEQFCIEISKRTPDAQKGANKDIKNEGRLNPFVGAVLIKKNEFGFEIHGGCRSAVHNGEHGECGLLTNILGNQVVDGCEMFVSLEPCTQESRHEWTEPCCEIIKNRRIKKVTIGMLDPNPDVAGHGIRFLIKNGIEVELFSWKNMQTVMEDNKDFSSQFGDDGDPRTNRKIAQILNTYVSNEAINEFLKTTSTSLGIEVIDGRDADNRHNFYKKMIENKSIIDGNKLLPFDVIREFALFFYSKPFHSVDGSTIRYIFDDGFNDKNNDKEDYNFDGPLIFAFDSTNSNDEELCGFLQCLGKKYSKTNLIYKNQDYKRFGLDFIKNKFGSKGLEIVREAFLNAIIHRDYEINQTFTKITLSDNYIKIENPVSRTLGNFNRLLEKFSNKIMPSHPINPKLMRYFMLMNMCERNGSGFKTFKNENSITFNLRQDFILETTLLFK